MSISAREFIKEVGEFIRDERGEKNFEKFEKLVLELRPVEGNTNYAFWRSSFEFLKRMKIFSRKHVNFQMERLFLSVILKIFDEREEEEEEEGGDFCSQERGLDLE